ncbi:MAG: UvrD-helicase domain-containing protein [Paludibacteraceae bacterium]|nr:UvrD-helicase domain-containing protein [Paludibacteraceae bacterium]
MKNEHTEAIVSGLNPSQLDAVKYNDGPSLIIAGAGSGKTRVLTCKIAYLLDLGLSPERIIALTFTNKAAKEMKARISSMVGEKTAKRLVMGTFHSVFSRILRSEAELLGIKNDFLIYDSTDSKSCIKAIIKDLQLDEKAYKPSKVLARISFAKNNLLSPAAYANSKLIDNDFYSKIPRIKDIYPLYMARLKQSSALDFDDLLFFTNVLFRDFPEVREKYQEIFQYVLVDEYQDTNFSQHLIVKFLAEKHHRVCVVGDDAQSIYSFRGANIENILSFKDTYPETKIFKLEQNYRSTKNIVNAANSLIAKNKQRINKSIFSDNEEGEKIQLLTAYSDIEEGFIVANTISELYKKDEIASWSDTVILYRTNAQSRLIEDALRKQSVPYRIYGGVSFYQRAEVKDVLAYIRLSINNEDEEAFKRIVNSPPRGIGDTTLGKVYAAAQLFNTSSMAVCADPLQYNLAVNVGTAKKLTSFSELIKGFSTHISLNSAYEAASYIVRNTGIIQHLQEAKSVENTSAIENIEELLSGVYEYTETKREEGDEDARIIHFLLEISLLTDQDTDKENTESRVTLMTIHLAKGLEFKNVFIVGLEEELLPSIFALEDEKALEEERRLFYVALTRAEKRCYLSYSKSRFRHGQMKYGKCSRFVDDIDPKYVHFPSDYIQNRGLDAGLTRASSFFNSSKIADNPVVNTFVPKRKLTKIEASNNNTLSNFVTTDITVDTRIEHERFGKGVIVALSGSDNDTRITVKFDNAGERVLLMKFAKFSVCT